MFGHAPFGGAPFAGAYSTSITTTLTAEVGAFVLAGGNTLVLDPGDFTLSGQPAMYAYQITAGVGSFVTSWPQFMTVTMQIQGAGEFLIDGEADLRRRMALAADWDGNATVEYVSTTTFIAMIESGDVLLTKSAEIRLRSL